MGTSIENSSQKRGLKQRFTKQLISDLNALEIMWEKGLFESGITRIGAEQEFCLIDYHLRPSMQAMEVLKSLDDPHFTTELALFNLEANLTPLELKERCFSELENQLISLLTKANKHAHDFGAKIILTGILPTIRLNDIVIDNITPLPRYKMLNDAMLEARGSDFAFHIHGSDELIHRHDSVLFESCNTSFQVHYQLQPQDAIDKYNWAHAISAPVLAAAVNSPMFLGKRLWHETRIALFQQATDTRKSSSPHRKERTRVTFGSNWATNNIIDIYREAIGRYEILMPLEIEEDSVKMVKNGLVPKLKALSTHNGTIYNWNRMCYGITKDKPHLRVECRYIPSGPTIIDETANTAFWIGLMHGMPDTYKNISDKMRFDEARTNFYSAAKMGMNAQFKWMSKAPITAKELIQKELLPIATDGLKAAGVDSKDISKYLNIIEERVDSGKTGASWILNSFDRLTEKKSSVDGMMVSLAEGIYQRQKIGLPVHKWSKLRIKEGSAWESKYKFVGQIMNGDLITVQPDDLIDLAINIMQWSNIHHLPVENKKGELVGLLTSDMLLNVLGKSKGIGMRNKTISFIMIKEVISVTPETLTIDAYNLMKTNEIGCLPVLDKGKLAGIITIKDYAQLIDFFFKQFKENKPI